MRRYSRTGSPLARLALVAWTLLAIWPIAARGASVPGRQLLGHADGVHALAFFPDGRRLVSASHDQTLRVWDVPTGRLLLLLEGHGAPVYCVDVSPDGKRIVSAGGDATARVWDTETGAQLAVLTGHTRNVRGVGFLPEGRVITGAQRGDGTVRVWDVATEREVWRATAEDCVLTMSLNRDRTRVAFAGCDGYCEVWDLVGRKREARFAMTGRSVWGLKLSPDGERIYSYDIGRLAIWDVKGTRVRYGGGRFIRCDEAVAVTSDGGHLLTGFGTIYDVQTLDLGTRLEYVPGDLEDANCAAISPDGRWAALGTGGGRVSDTEWKPGLRNTVQVFALPADLDGDNPRTRRPAPRGPATAPTAAGVAWDARPIDVRASDGGARAFGSSREYVDGSGPPGRWCTAGNRATAAGTQPAAAAASAAAADLFVGENSVYLHRHPGGAFDVVCNDPNAGFRDAAWDGRNFWVAAAHQGVMVVDAAGKTLATLGAAQGLPLPADGSIVVHPLGIDRVLVAGASVAGENKDGWCCVIEADAGASPPYRVRPVLRGRDLPPAWRGAGEGVAPTFTPAYVTEPPPSGARSREAWIVCHPTPASPCPILRVNADALTVTPFNVAGGARPVARLDLTQKPTWLSPTTMLSGSGPYWTLLTVDAGRDYLDDAAKRLACDTDSAERNPPVVDGERILLPGETWFSIDARTLAARRLGPVLPTIKTRRPSHDGLLYLTSAVWGPMAFDPSSGQAYRFYAHPAGDLGPVPAQAAAPPADVVADGPRVQIGSPTFGPGAVTFYAGLGDLTFVAGKLVTSPDVSEGGHAALEATERRLGVTLHDLRHLSLRLSRFESERRRLGMTDEQCGRLESLVVARPPAGTLMTAEATAAVESLYAAWAAQPAASGGRAAAAEPLFAEAKRVGERWAAEAERSIGAARRSFADEQWSRATYAAGDGR